MVYMIYSKAPFALVTKATSPIVTVKDLSGRKVGSSPGGASLQLLPLLLKKNGVDPSSVSITQVAPNLQEQILIQGQVDAAAVFTATSYMNLIAQKLDPDKDFRWIYYADSGIDLYSNGIMVSQKLAKEKSGSGEGPGAGHQQSFEGDHGRSQCGHRSARPNRAAAQQGHRKAPVDLCVQDADRHAGGAFARHRRRQRHAACTASIDTIAESYDLPRKPQASEVFDRSFLPPKAERMPVTLTN